MDGRLAAIAVAFVLDAGCFKATFDDRTQTPVSYHEQWRHRFIGGLVGDRDVDARSFCPDGRFAQVRTGGSLLTSLSTVFTLFIYSPRKVYITCAAPVVAR